MAYKNAVLLRTEAHEALAEALTIMVASMGPKQRREVAKLLAEAAGDYDEKAARLLLRLSLYVEPRQA